MKLATKLMTVAALVAVFAIPTFAQAQKIATANTQRILSEIKEFKDFEGKIKTKVDEARRQQENLQNRAKELQAQRDQFKAGSPEYDRANSDLLKVAAEAQVLGQLAQQDIIRDQKRTVKAMIEKIVNQVKTIAQSKQIQLVLAQVTPPELSDENWEKLNPDQATNLMLSRNLLFVAPEMDITNDVITALDAAHAAGQ